MQSQEKAISWTEGFRGYTVPMIVLKENYFSLTFAHYLVNYVLLVLRLSGPLFACYSAHPINNEPANGT